MNTCKKTYHSVNFIHNSLLREGTPKLSVRFWCSSLTSYRASSVSSCIPARQAVDKYQDFVHPLPEESTFQITNGR